MNGAGTVQYVCREVEIDCYREKPEDKDKPEVERHWELIHPAYIVVFENLVLYVGTQEEALKQMHLFQQASENEMLTLREEIKKHLEEIGPQKETCRGTHSEASGQRWRGLRPQK